MDPVGNSGISGTALLEETSTGNTKLTITLEGTPDGGQHPAHIHFNSAAVGGGIAVSLTPVNGTTGVSETNITQEDDGTAIRFSDLLAYDGYINVHLSANDLATVVAQGDIGSNELTGVSKTYDLNEAAVAGISGEITFQERINGFALATITLAGTPDGGIHPAHIHANSAATGGGIEFTFNPVNGTTGMSKTDSRAGMMNGEDGFTYAEILEIDGYVNVHLSADNLGTIVAQGDIGSNELTGVSKTYALNKVAIDGISGEIKFEQRVNGFALATITLTGTPDGGMHPAHIHANAAAIGGGIEFTFNPVNGTTGISRTDTKAGMMDGETGYSYAEILDVDGYVNVHLSADNLGTIVAQGDIGSNELTGESKTYPLNESAVAGISGEITFQKRINGFALATITLSGTPDGGMHPAHIHQNSAAVGGGILFTFKPVNGTTGMSVSDTRSGMMDNEASYTYAQILTVDGYVNVHLSAANLATIVAQGNIGSNFQ
ncbi:hypothetical protein P872_15885 [Rhodonellum psychrophilum GCM71 = DSM 17998]|uniref:CHRD domain-containing protein n=2 Tax=Rhodonellum TaxID=336827 RepID=U5C7T0_9BACT|nr:MULTISPECIES: CHRD domain-containing protein [Rhodonellum]ERM84262.1 hypothetical protein P872_15885 [Rhodonellum psychrophilum GCM71 = DSM 17998]SDZ18029.1 hypothetical protein SAMN05444412_10760 [Rhodonellum ikkaensis]